MRGWRREGHPQPPRRRHFVICAFRRTPGPPPRGLCAVGWPRIGEPGDRTRAARLNALRVRLKPDTMYLVASKAGPHVIMIQYVTRTRYFSTAVPSAATGTVNCAAHAAVLVHSWDERSIRHVPPIGSFTSTVIGAVL